jgi:ATP-binding protein involved in chromosome partitioning
VLDYIIVDLPPGTGEEPLSVAQLIKNVDDAIIVTPPQDLGSTIPWKSAVRPEDGRSCG